MTASATERDAREDASSWQWASLRIDFGAFEAFHAEGEPPAVPPRVVRWFHCFVRGECQ